MIVFTAPVCMGKLRATYNPSDSHVEGCPTISTEKVDLIVSQKTSCHILLLITAIAWGSGFLAQKEGAEVEPFTFNGARFLLAGLFLIAAFPLLDRVRGLTKAGVSGPDRRGRFIFTGAELAAGLICGLLLSAGVNLQQMGIYFNTDAGKAGFITALYIIFVPLLGLLAGRKISLTVWGCVLFGLYGFYLLTMAGKGSFALEQGDFFILLCSLAFAVHIKLLEKYAPGLDGVRLAAVQFLVTGLSSLLLMGLFEQPAWEAVYGCRQAILFGALVSTDIGYTLQVIGQQHADPVVASLLMSLEAVFAAVFGCIFLGEALTVTEGLGCAVIFTAVVIPQVLDSRR